MCQFRLPQSVPRKAPVDLNPFLAGAGLRVRRGEHLQVTSHRDWGWANGKLKSSAEHRRPTSVGRLHDVRDSTEPRRRAHYIIWSAKPVALRLGDSGYIELKERMHARTSRQPSSLAMFTETDTIPESSMTGNSRAEAVGVMPGRADCLQSINPADGCATVVVPEFGAGSSGKSSFDK